ncbi:hypothetical protein LTR84_006748 [Exophiala bonariae]|uniref:RNase III domain-containing protein n=1 Tax=Exophiala bonariae TaxID=1690606 RepID=A0AAV9N025_9EURO|nr:hypothetical protein LTR84_006748 [Exophiala bonariae]
MASSFRGSPSLCGSLFNAAAPRYVCRSCRKSLLIPQARQMREASTLLSSSQRFRGTQKTSEAQTPPRAFYASKTPLDYISPKTEQLKQAHLEEENGDEGWLDLEPYQEATTWVGLESVGQEGRFDQPPQPEDEFEPFITPSSTEKIDRDYFLVYLHNAIMDVLVYKTLGQSLTDLYTEGRHPHGRRAATSIGLAVSQCGAITGLQGDVNTLQAALSDSTRRASMSAVEMAELLSTLKFNFSDPITFEILKYFSFISGHRVPDPVLSNVWNNDKPLSVFIDLLTRHYVQTKPKTVVSTLKARQEKALRMAAEPIDSVSLDRTTQAKSRRKPQPLGPNVMVLPRRETPVDKEKEVGRWKLIEKELIERGLPVLGKYAQQSTEDALSPTERY